MKCPLCKHVMNKTGKMHICPKCGYMRSELKRQRRARR